MGFLQAFCSWLENTAVGSSVRDTLWGYPFVQLIHFTGLSVWLGTNVAVDLRLLGIGKNRETAAEMSQSYFAWNWAAFCVVVLGGFLLFSPAAVAYSTNPAVQVKLGILLPIALIWHIMVQRKTKTWGLKPDTPAVAKLAGLIEIGLWASVVTAAVSIPNY